jgi:hypothetical protein
MPRQSTRNGATRVKHREYVQDIDGSAAYAVQSLSVNPGLPSLFPWLSRLASRYEKYRFHDLKFHYEVADATSGKGTFMCALDYDASDDLPSNKSVFMSYHGAVRSAPWQDVTFHSSRANMSQQRFVRVGSKPTGTDIKLYDLGNFLLGRKGQVGSDMIGELYVEYDVELFVPTAESGCPSGKILSGGTVSKTAIFGTAATYVGALPCSASGSTVTFDQPGSFLFGLAPIGTGLPNWPAPTGTASSQALSLTTSSSTNGQTALLRVRAERGDTVIFDFSGATTVTSVKLYVASAVYDDISL